MLHALTVGRVLIMKDCPLVLKLIQEHVETTQHILFKGEILKQMSLTVMTS